MSSRNVLTHTGTVHAARTAGDRLVPACSSTDNLHYAAPTDAAVTCKRCLGGTRTTLTAADKAARKAARDAAVEASRIAGDAQRAQRQAERRAWLLTRADELEAAGDHTRAAAARADAAAIR